METVNPTRRSHVLKQALSRFAWCVALCIVVLASVVSANGADTERSRRVLMISTGNRFSAPGFSVVEQAAFETLRQVSAGQIEFYSEHLDIVRFTDESFRRLFRDYLRGKYADNSPDVIILIYVGNLAITAKLLEQLFPGVPVVVAGLTEEAVPVGSLGGHLTGVAQRSDPQGTIELMLGLQPETRRIVVIGGTAEVDTHVIGRARQAARSLTGRIEFDFWTNRPMSEITNAVRSLPPQTAILFTRMFRDAAGRPFNSVQAAQSIAKSANVPVYVMTDAMLGTGAVGGSMVHLTALGQQAGAMAKQILDGARAGVIVTGTAHGRRADIRLASIATLGHQRKPVAAQQHHSFPSAIDVGAISLVHHRSASAVLAAGRFDYRLGLESNQTAPG